MLNLVKKGLNTLVVIAIFVAIIAFSLSRLHYTFVWEDIYIYKTKFINGFIMTLTISFFAMIASLLIGTIITMFAKANIFALNYFAQVYIGLVRGTPFLVQIYLLIIVVIFLNSLELLLL